MPTAVKMQRELGDRLNTLFVEVQGHTLADVQRLALDKEWFGTPAMWTTERPVVTGARGIPNFVLLSSDGEVVMMGHPLSVHREIEDYVQAAARGRQRPPEALPKPLHRAWKELQKGDYADALAAAEKEAADDDGAVAEAARELADEISARACGEVERLARAIEEGVYARTEDRLEVLQPAVEGLECAAQVEELLARLESDELEDEIDAEKALAKVERMLFAKGADGHMAAALERVIDDHPGTKAAERARSWLTVVAAAGE